MRLHPLERRSRSIPTAQRLSGHPFHKLVTYDKMTGNLEGTLEGVLEHCGLKVDKRKLLDAFDAAGGDKTGKNTGVAGRGESLSDAVKDKILHYASCYPECDFSASGICRTARQTA